MCDIVIADDEHLERKVLKHIISGIKGARVVGECKTGRRAVESCAALMPHLVFFNYTANSLSGLEEIWKIRKNDRSIVIIVTTADERCLLREDFSALYISEFLLKPIRPSKIDEIVRKYMLAFNTKKAAEAAMPIIENLGQAPQAMPKTMTKEVSAALRYINSYFTENISLEDVADAVYLSSYYLSRLFKKEVGVNFSSYLLYKRLDEAKRLLKETDAPISGISSSLSFSDPSYFCKVFKKYTSSTPKEYRNITQK